MYMYMCIISYKNNGHMPQPHSTCEQVHVHAHVHTGLYIIQCTCIYMHVHVYLCSYILYMHTPHAIFSIVHLPLSTHTVCVCVCVSPSLKPSPWEWWLEILSENCESYCYCCPPSLHSTGPVNTPVGGTMESEC